MKKRLTLLLAAVMLLSLLAGCGGSAKASAGADSSGTYYAEEAAYEPMDLLEDGDFEEYWAGDVPMAAAAAEAAMPIPDPAPPVDTPSSQPLDGVKLIYTADLEMETLDFDGATAAINGLVAVCGGYFESSSVSDQGAYRWASYTIRVPAAQYRAFLDQAGQLCHVLSQQEYTRDVSESYYDTAGRLETQRTKLTRLQELLLQAEDMEDIITVESAISETEELIDMLSGELRHYDALVDYSTVSVYLEEVKVYEQEPDPTFGTRLGAAFSEGMRGFAEGLGDILIVLAYSWLWLLLIAAVVVLILWLTRKSRAAKKAERKERKARIEAAREARMAEPVIYSQPSEEPKGDDAP